MVSKPSALKFPSIVVALVFLAGCGGTGYTSGQKVDINCDKFPLKITYEKKDVWDSNCTRRNVSDPMLVGTDYHRFFRFSHDDDTAYANVYLRDAGEGTIINVRSVKDMMLGWPFVRKNGFGWGESRQTTVAGREYDYINFSLRNGRSCIGFNHYFEIKHVGYANQFYGRVCNTSQKMHMGHFEEFLKHVKYE